MKIVKAAKAAKHKGGVGRAAAKAGAHGDIFGKSDFHAGKRATVLQRFGSAKDEVGVIGWQGWIAYGKLNLIGFFKGDIVIKIDSLHEALDLMKAVIPLS